MRAGIAQLVEQRIRNAKVGGSTPLAGTMGCLGGEMVDTEDSKSSALKSVRVRVSPWAPKRILRDPAALQGFSLSSINTGR